MSEVALPQLLRHVGLSVPSLGFNAKGLRKRSMTIMTGDIMSGIAKLRTVLIRGLAVIAVVLTYTVSSIGTVGLAGLGLTATSTQAQAWWRGGYRRGWGGRGWGWGRRGYWRRRW
jgi:hypothetical protein